jgi:hypothetical protein
MRPEELSARLRQRLRDFIMRNKASFPAPLAAAVLHDWELYTDKEVIDTYRGNIRFAEALEIAAECETQEQWYAEIERLSGQLS